jgi:hypothetical protein
MLQYLQPIFEIVPAHQGHLSSQGGTLLEFLAAQGENKDPLKIAGTNVPRSILARPSEYVMPVGIPLA